MKTVHRFLLASFFLSLFLSITSNYQPLTVFAQGPTENITPTTTQIGPEEQAVYSLNQGTLPKEVIPEGPAEQSLFDKLISIPGKLFGFFQAPLNRPKVFAQAETLQQANIPEALKPTEESPLMDRLKGFLGGSTGFYSLTLPSFSKTPESPIQVSEKLYEKANFPDGINPITGQ